MLARIFGESPAATTSGFQILDFRFQIEGCLMQTGYLTKARMQPLTATFCFVLLGQCNLKSAICNP
jgi:hypothetical protein